MGGPWWHSGVVFSAFVILAVPLFILFVPGSLFALPGSSFLSCFSSLYFSFLRFRFCYHYCCCYLVCLFCLDCPAVFISDFSPFSSLPPPFFLFLSPLLTFSHPNLIPTPFSPPFPPIFPSPLSPFSCFSHPFVPPLSPHPSSPPPSFIPLFYLSRYVNFSPLPPFVYHNHKLFTPSCAQCVHLYCYS